MKVKNFLKGIHLRNKTINKYPYQGYINSFYSSQIKNFSNKSSITKTFTLEDEFINQYKNKNVNFGFNGLGELVYRRTYSRIKEDGTNEQWFETVKRVVEGTFNMLQIHINNNNIKVSAMLGVGVGFDTKAANLNIRIHTLDKTKTNEYIVSDSREGWVESVRILLGAYFAENQPIPKFNYSLLRPAGAPLKIFGGVSAGADPLIELHKNIFNLLERNAGNTLTSRVIVDIMNYIGKSVVAGNISNL